MEGINFQFIHPDHLRCFIPPSPFKCVPAPVTGLSPAHRRRLRTSASRPSRRCTRFVRSIRCCRSFTVPNSAAGLSRSPTTAPAPHRPAAAVLPGRPRHHRYFHLVVRVHLQRPRLRHAWTRRYLHSSRSPACMHPPATNVRVESILSEHLPLDPTAGVSNDSGYR